MISRFSAPARSRFTRNKAVVSIRAARVSSQIALESLGVARSEGPRPAGALPIWNQPETKTGASSKS